jgi:predicted alpha-1,2-mannosidase
MPSSNTEEEAEPFIRSGSKDEYQEPPPGHSTNTNSSRWDDKNRPGHRNGPRPIAYLIWAALSFVVVLILLGFPLLLASSPSDTSQDVLQYIDPLIGTAKGGHVFPGATLPFGMAKPVADVAGRENMGGFSWDDSEPVTGFSSLHDSGSGGMASMGNFPIFFHPSCSDISSCPLTKDARGQKYLPGSVDATPGYFGLTLESGVRAEMTASNRTSLFQFSLSQDAKLDAPVFLIDSSDLPKTMGSRSIRLDPTTNRITAEGSFRPSFGQGAYTNYQCIDIRGVTNNDHGVFNSTGAYSGLADTSTSTSISIYEAPKQGLYVMLADREISDQVHVRVGLSWLSVERACENAEREIPDFDFARTSRIAQEVWREKLKPIAIDTTDVEAKHIRNFWSGVYRAFLSPQDYTGENPLWKSTEPYYDSWYCIWDTFRGVHPLYMLMDTISQSRMVRSLVDIYKHEGWLPDCRMSFCKGYTQGGSNADVVIVDSFLKKLEGVNWDEAYAAIKKDAEVQPLNWNVEGRGGLKSWKKLGYIPYRDDDEGGLLTRSISRTVEYAYNDFCTAEMANATGRAADYAKYSKRAGNWKNLYDPKHKSMDFQGFLQPRWANGTFGYQDATLCSPINDFYGCFLDRGGHETYEGSPWLYSFYAPGDMQSLVDVMGGRETFLKRLQTLHESGVLDMGDEQAFLTAFLYHYAGRPGLSARKVHELIPSMFNDTVEGIPGNDDSGAMGTFVVFSMLGVFPSAGQNVYLIVPPFFPSISITNPQTGKKATIRSVNFDPAYKRTFVQSAKLNGKAYTKNWIDHNFFLDGGTLELVLSETESSWGTGKDDVPPSLSTGLYLG